MIIQVNNLVKRYKNLIALDHFNLEVEEGCIFGLLEPNGSEKTTAINCTLGLLNYDKGDIKVFGEELRANSYDLKRKIGLIPQEVAVFYNLTVYENIDYFCGLYIEDSKTRKDYVEEAIEFVGLGEYRRKLAKELSGGLKRRLNIACGLSHRPELIILDEPTVAVDVKSRNFMLNGIKKLASEGKTILYTSHYLEEVEELWDQILIMDKRKNVAQGSLNQLKNLVSTRERILIKIRDVDRDLTRESKDIQFLKEVEKKKEDIC